MRRLAFLMASFGLIVASAGAARADLACKLQAKDDYVACKQACKDDYRDANPHIRYFAPDHGFGLVTVTRDELLCDFHYVEDLWDPDAPISAVVHFRVAAGSREAEGIS